MRAKFQTFFFHIILWHSFNIFLCQFNSLSFFNKGFQGSLFETSFRRLYIDPSKQMAFEFPFQNTFCQTKIDEKIKLRQKRETFWYKKTSGTNSKM